MDKENKTRRTFLLTATSAGFAALASYAVAQITTESDSTNRKNDQAEKEVLSQAGAINTNQLVLMSDDEKKQRLADILSSHSSHLE
jgi:choline dehydrogenase-like flavoprotein